ncbi:MAG: hypothetical protein GY810_01490 [Aureispira sp.]|nr:hypothetical protein [Aureispira sp.]
MSKIVELPSCLFPMVTEGSFDPTHSSNVYEFLVPSSGSGVTIAFGVDLGKGFNNDSQVQKMFAKAGMASLGSFLEEQNVVGKVGPEAEKIVAKIKKAKLLHLTLQQVLDLTYVMWDMKTFAAEAKLEGIKVEGGGSLLSNLYPVLKPPLIKVRYGNPSGFNKLLDKIDMKAFNATLKIPKEIDKWIAQCDVLIAAMQKVDKSYDKASRNYLLNAKRGNIIFVQKVKDFLLAGGQVKISEKNLSADELVQNADIAEWGTVMRKAKYDAKAKQKGDSMIKRGSRDILMIKEIQTLIDQKPTGIWNAKQDKALKDYIDNYITKNPEAPAAPVVKLKDRSYAPNPKLRDWLIRSKALDLAVLDEKVLTQSKTYFGSLTDLSADIYAAYPVDIKAIQEKLAQLPNPKNANKPYLNQAPKDKWDKTSIVALKAFMKNTGIRTAIDPIKGEGMVRVYRALNKAGLLDTSMATVKNEPSDISEDYKNTRNAEMELLRQGYYEEHLKTKHAVLKFVYNVGEGAPKTIAALNDYQEANGLPKTDKVDKATLEQLAPNPTMPPTAPKLSRAELKHLHSLLQQWFKAVQKRKICHRLEGEYGTILKLTRELLVKK